MSDAAMTPYHIPGCPFSLPALDAPEGTLLESMEILRYLEDRFPERPVAQSGGPRWP